MSDLPAHIQARLDKMRADPACEIAELKDKCRTLEMAGTFLRTRVNELEAHTKNLETEVIFARNEADRMRQENVRLRDEIDRMQSARDALGSPARMEGTTGGSSNPVAIALSPERPASPSSGQLSLLSTPDPRKLQKERRKTGLQLWLEGAAAFAEATELACGTPPEAAKFVVNWGRDQKLLKQAYDTLGPRELYRRWQLFCWDNDPFVAKNRTLRFFASDTQRWAGGFSSVKLRRKVTPDGAQKARYDAAQALITRALQTEG